MSSVIRFNLLKSAAETDAADEAAPAGGALADLPTGAGDRAMVVTDASGRLQDANEIALSLLGYERSALQSLHISEVVAHFDEAVLDLVLKSEPFGRRVLMDAVCLRKEGGSFPAEIELRRIDALPDGGHRVCFEVREVKAGRRGTEDAASLVEARIARAERLEMAGTLAGQIAHDFNNLLTPLLAYPDLIRREISDNPRVTEYLDIMEKTASDMSRLTQQLLSLSRRGHVGNDVFTVNDVVEQVVALMQSIIGAGLSVNFDLADNLLPVKGSKDQIRRVIENLCQNALDAMGESGTLSLRTENVYLDSPVGQYGAVNVGEYVKIGVSDTGTGVPDGIKDKIFDPFFTTKRGGKKRGTGLGLSIVHGIVRDHRGYIDLETAVGKGSTFYVYLPIFREEVSVTAGDKLPHGTERLLVVDDDSLQVRVLVRLLEVLGYRVTGVPSGEEAVRLVKEGERFDLVILDMVLENGMDGLETFKTLRRHVPNQRAVLISGFTKAARNVARAQQAGAGAYLRKPLTIERVARVVRDELDAGKALPVAHGRGGMRLLIADDEHMIRKLFGMIIQSEFPDAVIDQASNGDEAVQAFQEGRPDLIILDLQMPKRDGREAFMAIARICEQQGWAIPSVIFCTGFTPPESLKNILSGGSIHCLLRKPVKSEVLLDAIRRRLRP